MRVSIRKLPPRWVMAALVFGLTIATGSRLVFLSADRHASQARQSAQLAGSRCGRALQTQLERLARLTKDRSARNVMLISATGAVSVESESDLLLAQSISVELAALDAQLGGANSTRDLTTALQVGTQWLVVSRSATAPRSDGSATGDITSAVSFLELDRLLANARIDQLGSAGYDFELSQVDRFTQRPRVLRTSRFAPLVEPVTNTIVVSGGNWIIALSPRAGWYPITDLGFRIAVLGTLALLLSVMAFDMAHGTARLSAALAASRRRNQAVNLRLVEQVQQREDLQRKVDHAYHHDTLTGLPNRRYFMNRLDQGLRETRVRRNYSLGVILVEISRLKEIYDTSGQDAGDELMQQAARRFEKLLSGFEQVVARWGAGQFALLLYDVHSVDTALSAVKLMQNDLCTPFELRNKRLAVSARFGVTCVHTGMRRAADVVREADIALAAAKSRGSREAVVFNSELKNETAGLIHLESDLHSALERREFQLAYQPIVELSSSRIVGVEALLRWQHPVEGLLQPDSFLAIAEEAGLLVPITRWVIRHACQTASAWRKHLPPGAEFYVSVNLPEAALRTTDLADYVGGMLERCKLPA